MKQNKNREIITIQTQNQKQDKTQKRKKRIIMETNKTMGARISELLNQKGMTQKQLSLKAGITEAAISHYIKGDRIPRASVLIKLAIALNTTSDYLLEGISPDVKEELGYAKKLIARNVTQMSKADKREIINILMEADDDD